MEEEVWKDIDGFPGYQVSNFGNVRSWLNNRYGIGKTYKILKQAIDKSTGYLKVNLQKNGKGYTKAVHVLVAHAFCPGEQKGYDVNHEDANKLNNHYTNLTWCTRSENMIHAYKNGLRTPIECKNKKRVKIIETGEIFDSLSDCARAIEGKERSISMCLNNKYNRKSHKGFHFENADETQKNEPFLRDYQKDAVNRMFNGCILNGGVGSGKSRTGLYYYFKKYGGDIDPDYKPMRQSPKPPDLYIITTAKKRDSLEFEGELVPFLLSTDPKKNKLYGNKVVIDSWNNIKKYSDVSDAFFIFDEDRVTGSGAWVKAFLKITKSNEWIILSATSGDTWTDYIPVFVANGFYKNKSEFIREHVIYSRFTKYPKIDRYVNTGRLIRLRDRILVDMDFKRKTVSHHEDVYVSYDISKYKAAMRNRWDPYKNEPIQQASGLCYILRRIVNEDQSRQKALLELFEKHPRMIVFYNFDYELDILKGLYYGENIEIAEWNGHKHQPIPESEKWVYLVQYTAGAEGWNCIRTDTIVFFSQNYSYKVMQQAAGRIDRLNTPYTDLYYYHLKTRSGIDLAISKALSQKKQFNERKFVKW